MIFESFGLICSLSDEIQHLKLIAIEIPVVLLPHCLPTDGLFVNNRSSGDSLWAATGYLDFQQRRNG